MTWDAVKGICLESWRVEVLSLQVLIFHRCCCGMQRTILMTTASPYVLDDAQSLNQVSYASMDAVICNMALMDIPDLAATLFNVRRILADNGRFIFAILHPCFFTPFNAENPQEEFDEEGNFKALRVSRYGLEGKWY